MVNSSVTPARGVSHNSTALAPQLKLRCNCQCSEGTPAAQCAHMQRSCQHACIVYETPNSCQCAVRVADVPAAAPSSLSVPELPSLSVPDLPKVSVPDLPKVSVPDVTAATDQLNASVSQAAAGE